jgi:hypothetical protein
MFTTVIPMSNGFYNPEMRPNVVRMIDGHNERIAALEWKRKTAERIIAECTEQLDYERKELAEYERALAVIDGREVAE